jgi:hypothetical protein
MKRKKEWRETNNRVTNDEKNEWWSNELRVADKKTGGME